MRTFLALVLFGLSFGYVEAAVVIYLRALYEPARQHYYPGRRAADLFPLTTLEQLESADPSLMRLLPVELIREGATLAMLAAIALAVARNFRQWIGAFLVAFGLWDICFYVFLKLLVSWPRSPWEWDLLFLVPVPWAAPVLAPMLVAGSMIGAGGIILWREALDLPVRIGLIHWALVLGGALVIVLAFCWDYQNVLAGGRPSPFNWELFSVGELVGLSGFGFAVWHSRARTDAPPAMQDDAEGTAPQPGGGEPAHPVMSETVAVAPAAPAAGVEHMVFPTMESGPGTLAARAESVQQLEQTPPDKKPE